VIDRRTFLAGTGAVFLAAPLAAEGQQTGKVWRIGHLGNGLDPRLIETFRRELRERDYVEGKNLAMELRDAEGPVERLPELAGELVRLRGDVIVANGTPATQAAKRASSMIPIVMVGIGLDPVELGLVTSLARPGANVTGVAALGADSDLWAKRLQLLKEALPRASRVAVLWNPANPGNLLALKAMKTAAPALGFTLHPVAVRDVTDFERAFVEVAHDVPAALVMIWDSWLLTHARRIADFAIEKGGR
jgi:putative ABC transport system substrate-binding protein